MSTASPGLNDFISYDRGIWNLYCIACSRTPPKLAVACDHIMASFWANADLQELWDLFPILVKIPISSAHDLWALVEIDGFADREGQAIVHWIKKPDTNTGLEPICIIGHSEGRKVIRDALLAFMEGDFDFNASCSATTHGLVEENIWNQQVRLIRSGAGPRVAQLWSVYSTGMCLPCNEKVNRAMGEVPERGNNVWNP